MSIAHGSGEEREKERESIQMLVHGNFIWVFLMCGKNAVSRATTCDLLPPRELGWNWESSWTPAETFYGMVAFQAAS